jgi:hypothetical protein
MRCAGNDWQRRGVGVRLLEIDLSLRNTDAPSGTA